MRMNEEQPERLPPDEIREVMLETVKLLGIGTDEAEQLLLQCVRYFHNHRLVHHYAKELGLELGHGIANAALQVYYDIHRHGGDWGYISRGWDEPGFRIGQVLTVPNIHLSEFRRRSEHLIRNSATRGITITIESEQHTARFELHLTLNILDGGFNPGTLMDSLENLFAFTQHLGKIIPCG